MVATSPDAAVGHYNLGKVWDDANRNDDAVASFRKAIELDPARADAWINLGIDLHKRGDKDEALKAFLRADELKPGVASTQFNIGLERVALGQFGEALAAFDEARRLDPNLPAGWDRLRFRWIHRGTPLTVTVSRDELLVEAAEAAAAITAPGWTGEVQAGAPLRLAGGSGGWRAVA